ncbi:hypothetical protein JOL79_24010 [Microbispora sp. RL4-1S]|uniref:Uncharacterized protein n=1 Tax=Microbispora oryzae TaxID=2806554 RepID=A0A940WN31_9ACTN|nr:hypothetical protein [Microbispora oryzae]MBP2706877.1 hypothetical protein [Microbispora oryzae]
MSFYDPSAHIWRELVVLTLAGILLWILIIGTALLVHRLTHRGRDAPPGETADPGPQPGSAERPPAPRRRDPAR